MQDATPSTTDLSQLQSQIQLLSKENEQLKSRMQFFETECKKPSKILAEQVFGKRREKHVSPGGSPWLPFESQEEMEQAKTEAEAEAQRVIENTEAKVEAKPKKPRSEALPNHLPIVTRVMDVPEKDRVCETHGPMSLVGTDETEKLVLEPAKLYRVVTKYPKYGCSCCKEQGVVSAERPTGLVEGDKYDTSVAAAIVQKKYDLHLPVYRQQDIFAGSGWTPSRSTLLNILRRVDFVLEPFVSHMAQAVKEDSIVGLDDTKCRMLMPSEAPDETQGNLKAKRLTEKMAEAKEAGEDSIMGKMWVYRGADQAPYNIFDFRISRHRDGPDEFFAKSRCFVQGDCFSGNKSVAMQSNDRLKFVACWAHARRKVYEVNRLDKHRDKLLDMIQALYDVNAREDGMSTEARLEHRQLHAVPVLAAIRGYIDTLTDQEVLPKSEMADALRYLRNNWDALNVYTTDGRIPIDNNQVEQLMKQVALGRKAWLFVGNVEAGERSARLMSIVSSAKRHDLDVWAYLKDILDRLLAGQTEYESLLPNKWKDSHPEAIREYRVEERRDKADRKQLDRARRKLKALQKK